MKETQNSCKRTAEFNKNNNTDKPGLDILSDKLSFDHIYLLPKGTYLVDMDGVLFDYAGTYSKIWNKTYGSKGYPRLYPSRQKEFRMEDNLPEEYYDLATTLVEDDADFFRNLPPIKGAIEGIQRLAENNPVYICTAPNTSNDYCAQGKIYSIRKHLGNEWVKRTIITKDKTIVKGNYLIDDKPQITGAFRKSWTHILYDQPYNKDVETDLRFSWTQGILSRHYSRSDESELDKLHVESMQRYYYQTGQISKQEYQTILRKLKFGIRIEYREKEADNLKNKLNVNNFDLRESDVWND